jgi:hypothetical protein
MKHLKTPQELNEASENLNISDVKYSEVNILQLKKSVEETIQLFHPAIWALEDGSKEQEMFMSANNRLNDFYHKYLKKY